MRNVGVRELKAHASEIVDAVTARRERVQITKRGKAVAVISPLPPLVSGQDDAATEHDLGVWAQMDQLAEEIGRRWPTEVSAVDALAADRR